MKHRKLPHLDVADVYQFVTFRTQDSLDHYLRKLYSTSRLSRSKQQEIDEYLDHSKNGAYLYGEALRLMLDSLAAVNGECCILDAYTVMPNHVHMLLKPLVPLPELVKIIKGRTARRLNRLRGVSGQFWAADYFDRIVRDERHYRVVYRYIRNNSLKLEADSGTEHRFYGIHG